MAMAPKKMRGGGMVKKMKKGGEATNSMSVAELREKAKAKGYKLVKAA